MADRLDNVRAVRAKATVSCLVAGVATACSLLLPWFHVGGPPRSTLEVIAAAGALDVIEGRTRALVVAAWTVVPVSVALALFAAAARRARLAGGLVAGSCSLVVGIACLLALTRPGLLAWGAVVAVSCAIVAVSTGIVSMVVDR